MGQTYPARPITLVVPFAAGGPSDVLARIVTDKMSRTLGQQIVIENVAGAGGTTGSARAARATPDGHTLLSGNLGSHGAAFTLYKNLGYDPRAFAPVGMVAGTPNFVIVRNDFPARTLAEFLAYAKAHPDEVTAGHAGNGSNGNLVCLLLETVAGIKLRQVPYRGSGPAMNDLVGGQIDAMCDSAPTVVPQVQAKTVRALVTAQDSRLAAVPDVPTASEAGLPAFQVTGWNAFFAPPDTPKPAVTTINRALSTALTDPAVVERLAAIGAVAPPLTERSSEWLGAFVRAEVDTWGRVLREAGATPN